MLAFPAHKKAGIMAKEVELGGKHECPNCGAKFYDLGKSDPKCPKCDAGLDGEPSEKE